jgi:hypothetical protein
MKNTRQQRIEEVKINVEKARMEKKVNWMVELMEQNPLWVESQGNQNQDRYLMSNQSQITKEDLEQLAEWARNQIPANREDNQGDDDE